MKPTKIIIGIVDDHQLVIDRLTALLENENHIQFAFATTHAEEVMQLLNTHTIDILLTDVMMPGLTDNQLAKQVKEKYPNIKIMALSMSGQGDLVNEMVETAALAGYVLKNSGKQELVSAIEKVAAGGIYFSPEVLEEMNRFSQRKKQKENARLTEREIEIIRLIEKEYNNKQIANTLFISERTVETHRKNIFRKLDTGTVIGLVKYAYEHKLI
jgi:two-component system nitrate/nitrite response regulator NarL